MKRWAHFLIKKLGHRSHCLSIVIVSDVVIKKLNRRFRGQNKPTDVLSFSPPKKSFLVLADRCLCPSYPLGDIVISAETAKRHAKQFGKTFEEELKSLLIHGFLHLLGYDHKSKKEKIKMQKKEKEYINILRDL